jgi:hypothetical protein
MGPAGTRGLDPRVAGRLGSIYTLYDIPGPTMTTPARIAANRLNGQLSKGPTTAAGKAIAAANSLDHGLYAAAVLPALGESPDEFAALAAAVRDELRPDGALQEHLVDRITTLIWRWHRLARYDSAATAAAVATVSLPPDPDGITGDGVDTSLPLPAWADPARRLAHLRARLAEYRAGTDNDDAAAELLHSEDGPATRAGVAALRHALWQELGWGCEDGFDRWAKAVDGLGAPGTDALAPAEVRTAVARAAGDAGRDPADVGAAVLARLEGRAGRYRDAARELEAEDERLAGEMRAARRRAGDAASLGDAAAVERVLRVEAHLTRQLETTLALFGRLAGSPAPVGLGVVVAGVARGGTGGGFVAFSGGPVPGEGHAPASQPIGCGEGRAVRRGGLPSAELPPANTHSTGRSPEASGERQSSNATTRGPC